jgi:hypothetical protein
MRVNTKASFDKMTVQQGKTTLQFVLDQAEQGRIPDLSQMTGKTVLLDVESEQATIFDMGTPGGEE